jgi:hypothetical protein
MVGANIDVRQARREAAADKGPSMARTSMFAPAAVPFGPIDETNIDVRAGI